MFFDTKEKQDLILLFLFQGVTVVTWQTVLLLSDRKKNEKKVESSLKKKRKMA